MQHYIDKLIEEAHTIYPKTSVYEVMDTDRETAILRLLVYYGLPDMEKMGGILRFWMMSGRGKGRIEKAAPPERSCLGEVDNLEMEFSHLFLRRRPPAANPAKPDPIRIMVAGLGTGVDRFNSELPRI